MALLKVKHLQVKFELSSSIDWRKTLRSIRNIKAAATSSSRLGIKREKRCLYAVDDVSFEIEKNQSVGLVGESGCGKSTLVRALSRLLDVDDGDIILNGEKISAIAAKRFVGSKQRQGIQVVFQDSHDSLNPRYSAYRCIADPLINLLKLRGDSDLNKTIYDLAEKVSFPRELLTRLPHQLSGGQKARVNIARAIAVSPQLLILDEPTSALDVSVQAVILKLLEQLKTKLQLSYLFVSHDLNVVRMLCDKILVMYMGKIVEFGDANKLYYRSLHPYTKALISSIPSKDVTQQRILLSGEVDSPINPDPNSCRFYNRCPNRLERCRQEQPALRKLGSSHHVACHLAD